jgi:hypothetical protein
MIKISDYKINEKCGSKIPGGIRRMIQVVIYSGLLQAKSQ